MKKTLSTLLGIAIAVIIVFIANSYFSQDFSDQLNEEISALNADCPVVLDELTTLDSAKSPAELTVEYFYTLKEFDARLMDTSEFSRVLKAELLDQNKEDEKVKGMLDAGVTMQYTYYDENSRFISSVALGPEDYR